MCFYVLFLSLGEIYYLHERERENIGVKVCAWHALTPVQFPARETSKETSLEAPEHFWDEPANPGIHSLNYVQMEPQASWLRLIAKGIPRTPKYNLDYKPLKIICCCFVSIWSDPFLIRFLFHLLCYLSLFPSFTILSVLSSLLYSLLIWNKASWQNLLLNFLIEINVNDKSSSVVF